MNYAQMKESVMEMVSHHFRPEFINRIDEVVVFHPLGENTLLQLPRFSCRVCTSVWKSAVTK